MTYAHVFFSLFFSSVFSLHIRSDSAEEGIEAAYRSFPLTEPREEPVEVQMRQFIAGMQAVPAPGSERKSQLSQKESCESDLDRKAYL